MKSPKPYIIYALALILFLGIMILSYNITTVKIEKPRVDTEPFRESLWDTWGVAVVIVAFIILAGGIGILVLLGGDWRWE
jgi:fumarate reductase subunit C